MRLHNFRGAMPFHAVLLQVERPLSFLVANFNKHVIPAFVRELAKPLRNGHEAC